jgi:uncharacterized membrane protein
MVPVMIALGALVIWGVVALVGRDTDTASTSQGAEGLLAERFARGDIDEDEYRRHRSLIRS